MKKYFWLFAFCCIVFPNAIAQPEIKLVDSSKRAYLYFVKIVSQNGEKTKAVLSRFSGDSVFIISYDDKYLFMGGKYKVVGQNNETGLSSENIKTLFIRKDRTIIDRDTLEKYKSGIVAKNIGFSLLGFGIGAAAGSLPISGGGGLSAISTLNTAAIAVTSIAIVTGTLVLASSGKKFTLNGDKEKFCEMILELTGLKKISLENE